ncbi:MAG: glutathione S-transferase N-terminal domain-containing protein [Lentilitoribacter sp.]
MASMNKSALLYGGSTSPFSRMAKLYGDHLNLDFKYELIDIYNAEFLDELNPLRQIPTLILDDGNALFDSRTIFSYFEDQAGCDLTVLDFQQSTRISLALGMADACLQYRMEMMLSENDRNEAKILKLKARMDRSVKKLNDWADDITAGKVRLEQFVVACSLEYLDFRYTKNWREECRKLDAWLEVFSQRDDMIKTRPVG